MFESFSRSWEYAKLSLSILNENRVLIVFPLLSGAAAILVLVSFFLPLNATGALEAWTTEGSGEGADLAGYITLFCFYLANYFVILFFNCALIFAVVRYIGGEAVTIGGSLRDACGALPQIFGWAFISAVFGLLINALERNRKIGSVVSALLGSAWTALTYFVLPVIVVERSNPATAVKRSISILKGTWGTALVGNFSLGFIGFLLLLPVFLVAGALVYLGLQSGTSLGMYTNFTVAIILAVTGLAADSALGHIFRAVLYCHATGRSLPAKIRSRDLEEAFAHRS